METKEQLIEIASELLIDNGYNAFSYKTISEKIGIKTSSIHYHFPSKVDLGISVVKKHQQAMEELIARTQNAPAIKKLEKIFTYYKRLAQAQKVCIVGALTSDISTLEEPLKMEIIRFSSQVIDFIVAIFEQGQYENTIAQFPTNQIKARNVIATMVALVQFRRIDHDYTSFAASMDVLWNELTIKN
ncbi:MAG: TetR/AcrR family transcriptional regulator [Pseudopedobacter saltans]|uniref:TetR/AcrR family transcriptional regulator n=1 Tax=Pseudopedobacter saltans TaxID=151895 RepID=A0A2W5EK91_9SPHI|nr:MAG: TetR/AcrR family transcriptional regulator [Pseudopedobacter saltans]